MNLPFPVCTPIQAWSSHIAAQLFIGTSPSSLWLTCIWHDCYYLVCFHEHLKAGSRRDSLYPSQSQGGALCEALEGTAHRTQQIDFM